MTHFILTNSGTDFDLINPNPNSIKIEDIASALSKLCRHTGHTKQFYSVAEHSILVSKIVQPEHALAALLHDATEAYLGDVSSPLKALLPNYKIIEKKLQAVILKKFTGSEKLPDQVKHADLIALATERRDLMPPSPSPWTILNGIPRLKQRIEITMPHYTAKQLFLGRYKELSKKCNYPACNCPFDLAPNQKCCKNLERKNQIQGKK